MEITREVDLSILIYENENTRLLIQDIVNGKRGVLIISNINKEISEKKALRMWRELNKDLVPYNNRRKYRTSIALRNFSK